MHGAGWKLRQVRERLNLTYRDIEEATGVLASARLNPEFLVPISRLFEIENKDVVPSMYRIYSLCVAYRLDIFEVLRWYGLDLREFDKDTELVTVDRTHLLAEPPDDSGDVRFPIRLDPGINLNQTTYLSRMIQAWGAMPLSLLRRLDTSNYRYARIGFNDWMMYPLITPGALVQIDPQRRKLEFGGWRNEFERPIYFVETREGYVCSWVMPTNGGCVLLQPYTLSPCRASVKSVPADAEVIGQVTGVAMRLCPADGERVRLPADQ